MALFSRELGIDLGTMYIRVVEGRQLLFEEPTIAAIVVDEQKMVAWGQEALDMFGKVPDTIEVTRPLQNGVVADYEVTENMLRWLLRKLSGPFRIVPPKVMITIPYGITSVESRAVHEAILEAGTREAYLIHQPLAAAIGADMPIGTPSGNMVLCLGGGVTQAAVIAMYGIVAAETTRMGGMALDEAIISYVRKKYGLIIGPLTAEQLKINIGAAIPLPQEDRMDVQGQDQVSGLPRGVTLTTGEIVEAIQAPLKEVIETARRVLEKTPPELVADILDRGIAMTGGLALLRGLDRLLTKELGVPTYLVDNPKTAVAEGAARGIKMVPVLRRSLPSLI
ncbi:MAG: rod shape-determining protein [Anaerolineales bacterium]|nr:rod shape-determining protein [Anaerolineales bacterium]MCS7247032.1 rod shape-determining protein [Anaerolineales bacterium]MDW8160843.1 rod shape-determining protein [Anaerolineales bacterium]MDW8446801.1 rod shape-determining protein [Anaerolineales bacterium]